VLLQYYLFASTIQGAALFHQENIFSTFRSLAETITASSFATEETFPFVTVPGFEVAGRHARIQSGIEILAYTPLISKENTSLWQQYAFSRQGWIDESRSYVEATVGALSGGNFINTTITPILWERDVDQNAVPAFSMSEERFAPFWQLSPPPFSPAVINYNMFALPFCKRMYPLVKIVKGACETNSLEPTILRCILTFSHICNIFDSQRGSFPKLTIMEGSPEPL